MAWIWDKLIGDQSTGRTTYGQLIKLSGGFGIDDFSYYDSWYFSEEKKDAIVYRINTDHATVSKVAGTVFPVRANTVFLKIQGAGSFSEAFQVIKRNAPSQMVPPAEFENGETHKSFMTVWGSNSRSGKVIIEFVKRNEGNIKIEVDESYNGLRLYKIAWAPYGGTPSVDGMDDFIKDKFGSELNMSNWTPSLTKLAKGGISAGIGK